MSHTSSDSIAEALKLLEQAAKEKKGELKDLISDKYTHLRDVLVDAEGNLAKSMSDAGKHALEAATLAKDAGVEKALEIADDVDKNVHRNPWLYIAGTAGAGVLLGYILSRNHR